MDWTREVVFLTGAASGIGKALARDLADHGASIAMIDLNEHGLNELKKELPTSSQSYLSLRGDVTDPEDLRQCFDRVEAELGIPTVVVANAGLGYTTPADNLDIDAFKRLMSVNYDGVVNTITEGLNRMLGSGQGNLVITSSVAAFTTMKGGAAYSASKNAVLRFAESLRLDLEDEPISVTTIHPGWVKTPMTEKYPDWVRFGEVSPEEAAEQFRAGIESRQNQVIFPWGMKLLVNLMTFIPDAVLDLVRERMPMPEELPTNE
jgi:NAD(P)-dependent dehydrogenase (short-subunit alcohol dehydrogenase family)